MSGFPRACVGVLVVAFAVTGACSGSVDDDGASGGTGADGGSGASGGVGGSSAPGGTTGGRSTSGGTGGGNLDASLDATVAAEDADEPIDCSPQKGPGCYTCGQVFNHEPCAEPAKLCGWSTTTKSAEKFEALVDCMCGAPCATECDSECGGEIPRDCSACLKTACKAELDVCNDDDGT